VFKQIIKTALWIISAICLYIIVTTRDPRGFGLVAVAGFLCTWVLLKWDKIDKAFEEYLDEKMNVDN